MTNPLLVKKKNVFLKMGNYLKCVDDIKNRMFWFTMSKCKIRLISINLFVSSRHSVGMPNECVTPAKGFRHFSREIMNFKWNPFKLMNAHISCRPSGHVLKNELIRYCRLLGQTSLLTARPCQVEAESVFVVTSHYQFHPDSWSPVNLY